MVTIAVIFAVSAGGVIGIALLFLVLGAGGAYLAMLSLQRGDVKLTKGDVDPEDIRRLADGHSVDFNEESEIGKALNEVESTLRQAEENQSTDLEEAFNEFEESLKKVGDGDFTQRVNPNTGVESIDEFGEQVNLAFENIEKNLQYLRDLGSSMAETTGESRERVNETGKKISASVEDIENVVEDQMVSLDTTLNSMEDISASIEEVSANTDKVAGTAERTAETSKKGRRSAEEASEGLSEIQQSSEEAVDQIEELERKMKEISDVVDVISKIAKQTNMLAINAGIEASRAGEAGEGFSVVADEVKSLADETAERANEIEKTLSDFEDESNKAVNKVIETQENIDDYREDIQEVINAMDEVADYVGDTSDGIQQISDAMNSQSAAAQEVVETVDKAVKTNKSVLDDVETITDVTEKQYENLGKNLEMLGTQADQLNDTINLYHVDAGKTAKPEPLTPIDKTNTVTSKPAQGTSLDTHFGTGYSTRTDSYKAGREAAQRAKNQLGLDRVDFAQVFCRRDYDFDDLLKGVRSVIGDESKLIGCTTAGEFTEDGVVEGVTVGLVTSDTVRFFTGLGHNLSEGVTQAVEQAAENIPRSVEGYPHLTAINLHDGLSGMGGRTMFATRRVFGPDTRVAGGAAGDAFELKGTYVFHENTAVTDGVVLALMASKHEPYVSASHGHEPMDHSQTYTVTKAEGGTVAELDGRSAYDVWYEYVSEFEENLDEKMKDEQSSAMITAKYEVGIKETKSDGTEEYRVRWPGLTDPSSGSLSFATEIPEGEEVVMMRSDRESQFAAAETAAQDTVDNADNLAGGFVYECGCRNIILGEEFDDAVGIIADELDVPFAGLETYGELCQQPGQLSGFHNTTSVVLGVPK